MIKAVIFDMYETLVTLHEGTPYFGTHIAEDAQIPESEFYKMWNAMEDDRSIGKITLEETIQRILREHRCYTEEKFQTIIQKRNQSREECFQHLHPEILPMLRQLKELGIKIGLISNCFSEEMTVIQKSVLFPYFDAACLSYEQGVQKPDPIIYTRCMEQLGVEPEECFYIGDGGSHELEAAQQLGLHPFQAAWYLKDGTKQPCQRKKEFIQLDSPMEVICQLKQDAMC